VATDVAPKERALPHNPEAERTVLGAILVDNAAFNSAAEILGRDDFYRDAHRRIFEAMAVLAERSQPIDLVTLKNELLRQNALEAVGGAPYLAALVDGLPRVTSVEHWSRIIKERAVLRNLIHAGNRIVQSCFEGEEDAAALLDRAEKAIFDIAERRIRAGFLEMREIVKESFRTIDQLSQSKDVVTGLPTGFVDIDEMTSGLQKGDLVIVAARPAMGKTSLCLNIAQHVALRVGETVGLFSLEMSKEQLALRMLCADARVDAHRLRTGKLNEKDWARLAKAYTDLSQSRIFIDDSATITPLEMRAKCRRLKAEHGLSLIVVDYLQLVSSSSRVENRQQEMSAISRSMKGLAKELDVPVLALSQLSRAPEARTDRRPQLSDLRECVTGDTLVLLADGRRVPIRELVGSTPEVLALSPDRRIVTATSDRVWNVGRRRVFDVHLASGRRIRATGRHRLLGASGWVRVSGLAPGASLAIARGLPAPANARRWPADRVVLAGVRANPNVDTLPREVFAEVKAAMRRRGVTQRAMAGLRGTAYGGSAQFRFAPSRATVTQHAQLLDEDQLRRLAEDDLFWDRVVAIEPVGEEEVFDLTVPGPASWLADGIVSHNSGALEQDADIVMFIYREEEYKPTDENKGLAEIIIGKQRNGPTGNRKLAFIKEFTRFENLDWRGGQA
jgi:replicative DNA helicase